MFAENVAFLESFHVCKEPSHFLSVLKNVAFIYRLKNVVFSKPFHVFKAILYFLNVAFLKPY